MFEDGNGNGARRLSIALCVAQRMEVIIAAKFSSPISTLMSSAHKPIKQSSKSFTQRHCRPSLHRAFYKPVRFTCQNVKKARAKIVAKQRMRKVRREFKQNGSFRSACVFTCQRTEHRAPSTSTIAALQKCFHFTSINIFT